MEEHGSAHGRVIDDQPALTLLLEPRSLVITTASLYTEHLHGIDPVSSDVFTPDGSAADSSSDEGANGRLSAQQIANATSLKAATLLDVVRTGGVLNRATRVSLTCRDVERAISNVTHR